MNPLTLAKLRCEYLHNPLGIDEPQPRLSWQLQGQRRGAKQRAYRITVASSAEKLASKDFDLWDSGLVESAQSNQVEYQGKALRSRTTCHWQVEVKDEHNVSHLSRSAFWTMGLLSHSDWHSQWLAADPEIFQRDSQASAPTLKQPGSVAYFRKEFSLSSLFSKVVRATVYVSARGVFELSLNGQPVSEDIFSPEWTDYHKRIHYRSYDISHLLRDKKNCFGAKLGDGWWSGFVGWQEDRGRYGSLENSLLIQCEIELEDGRRLDISSDDSWHCSTGPILFSDFMLGETYDARRNQGGWDQAEFLQHSDWLKAKVVRPPKAPLVAQMSETVRIIEELKPLSIKEVAPQTYIFDFGQNLSGYCRLQLPPLPAGTKITLRHGERLDENGKLYTENLRRAQATDTYICQGEAPERYQPLFTFHGFQFMELSGLPKGTDIAEVEVIACVIHSAMEDAGHFSCSHPGVNRLWLNALWSHKDNFISVPSDCPQRDERLGWTGDAQVFMRTATYNFNVAAFFTKWMQDIADAQTEEGIFPDTAPRLREDIHFVGLGNLGGAAAWADAGIIVPYTLWKVYGDTRILKKHYSAMVRWIDWIERHNPDGLRTQELGNNYGDWLCIPADTSFGSHSPMKYLLATAYWADGCNKLSEIAAQLELDQDAQRLQKLFEKIRSAFQNKWLQSNGELSVDTQTAYLLALNFQLLPESAREEAAKHLEKNIINSNGHLNTGFIGVGMLNPQLSLAGKSNLAYKLLLNENYPSWLYPVNNGATTIWERWDGWTKGKGFFNPEMNSFNHYSLGSVAEWLYRHVAGIELAPGEIGFQHFLLRPYLDARLREAEACYQSLYGEIKSHWHRNEKKYTWFICIPANCSAQIVVPFENSKDIFIDDQELNSLVEKVRCSEAKTSFVLTAGLYQISWPDLNYLQVELNYKK